MKQTNILLLLLLLTSVVNIWSSLRIPAAIIQRLEEEEVTSQKTTFTVSVTDGSGTIDMEFVVETTYKEFDPNETPAEWNERHMDTVKAAKDEAESYDLGT